MNEVQGKLIGDQYIIQLSGHVDSGNASAVENAVIDLIGQEPGRPIHIDAEQLDYISSAGLRVILHLRKTHPELTISNVKPDVYEIFEMTGFTQMMTIEKAYRVVSIEGCEEIGRGANGTIYRIDKDNVVKSITMPTRCRRSSMRGKWLVRRLSLGSLRPFPTMLFVWEKATALFLNFWMQNPFPNFSPPSPKEWTGVSGNTWNFLKRSTER